MARHPLNTAICRVAAIRARSQYIVEKAKVLDELREARQRGEDPKVFLEAAERSALAKSLLSVRR